MMKYEEFKEKVAERFLRYMGPEYQGYRLIVHPVSKVNQNLDAINIIPNDGRESSVSPALYINFLYEHYQECGNLQEVLQTAAVIMTEGIRKSQSVILPSDFDNIKDKIVITLVNTTQNQELLANVPNRPFQDLSIIYRLVVEISQDGISNSIINNSLAEALGATEEDLYQLAIKNTEKLFPPTVNALNNVMKKLFEEDGIPNNILDMMFDEISAGPQMYVISNNIGVNGSSSILYENVLEQLTKHIGTDLYILPSSIHEVIAISTHGLDPTYLAQMVNEVNMEQVALEDRLSNQVYHYNKDSGKLSMATNTPNKKLDNVAVNSYPVFYGKL